MGPLMSMVTCSVTSVTTTVSSVFFAPVLVSYIVHTDHGFFQVSAATSNLFGSFLAKADSEPDLEVLSKLLIFVFDKSLYQLLLTFFFLRTLS